MNNLKKFLVGGLIAACAITVPAAVATWTNEAPATANAAEASTYTTKDIAMMGRIAGWHGNGNFEISLTLGEADWTNANAGQQNYTGGELKTLLASLDFFNHIKLGDKTLAEWGCTACYGNYYWLNEGEPDSILRIPLAMSKDNMTAASAAGIGANVPLTVLEGALIPSHAYLQGDATATVYRAGCDFVSTVSEKAYGIESIGKTEVESIQYATGWDSTYNNAYFGISLKGDDYLSDGGQLEVDQNYYYDSKYCDKILINGEGGKTEAYGLFNLGDKGKGYFSFVMRVEETLCESVTIPAGTRFPSRAMANLRAVNGNPVYIMYETQTSVTFYKSANGFVTLDAYKESQTAAIDAYRATKADADYFAADVSAMNNAVATAKVMIASAENVSAIDTAIEEAKAVIDSVEAKAVSINAAKEEIAAYKATAFRDAENAQRLAIVELANEYFDEATTKEEVTGTLAMAKSEIDKLKTAAQYADEELAEAKANAVSAIEAYLNDTVYLEEQAAERAAAIEAGKTAVAESADETAINAAVASAKAAMDAIQTKAAIVAAAKADLDAYKADELYRDAETAARAEAIATANTAIDAATTQALVNEAVASAKATIDTLKTDAELTAEEAAAALAAAKEAATAALNAYNADENLYREEEVAARAAIIEAKLAEIAAAESIEAVDALVAAAKAAIDELTTAEEYAAAEALAAAKEAAKATLNEAKAALDLTKYTEENQALINNLYADAKAAIEAATTIESAQELADAFLADLASVEEIKAGCSSTVSASAVIGMACLLGGAIFVASKKRKED